MFNNISSKIKGLAYVITAINIISSIFIGALLIVNVSVTWGIVAMVLGTLVSWTCSFVLYGFGQMIEDTTATRMYSRKIAMKVMDKPQEKICHCCGNYIVGDLCPFCNTIAIDKD